MITTTSIPNQAFPKDSFTPRGRSAQAIQLDTPEPTTCHWYSDRVVKEIEHPEVREIVGIVFKDLLRFLDCLNLIERHLRRVDSAEETFALFELIHDEASSLIRFIHNDALNCPQISEELADTLDGITFAINHDLKRVFDGDHRISISDKTIHVVLGKLHRAHDVLTNCLQQSTIRLAVLFDSDLIGAKLFNNSDMRYRQSLQLCNDLFNLRQLVESLEETRSQAALSQMLVGIEIFRNESMEYLMYSDWPQFESFCKRINSAHDDITALAPILHQFLCYLETLLGQVKMRAVLTEGQSQSSTSNYFSSSFQTQEQPHISDSFVFAV